MKKKYSEARGYRTDRVKRLEKEKMKKLRETDHTISEIAEKLGRSERTVIKHLEENPSAARTSQTAPTDTPIQVSQPSSEATLEHDRKIFQASDAILNEGDIRQIVNDLSSSCRLESDMGIKLGRIREFFLLRAINIYLMQ